MTRPPLALRGDGQIVVTGSLAFDQIMVFPGNFKDHILPEKLHVINISFLVSEMRKQRGGCAGNIAYTLALLETPTRVVAAAGADFADYRAFLEGHGVDCAGIRVFGDDVTASCHITADLSDNQITGFFPGAMRRAGELSLQELAGDRPAAVIVAPDDPQAMIRHSREACALGLPFIFDPSFQVTAMTGEALAAAAQGAALMMLNDYEFAVFCQKTGKDERSVFDLVNLVVVTLGGEGSKILFADGRELMIPPAQIARMVEPTGAGDAFRGGFTAGLLEGHDLEVCGRMGSIAAAYVVEQNGPQVHAYNRAQFEERYAANFGSLPRRS